MWFFNYEWSIICGFPSIIFIFASTLKNFFTVFGFINFLGLPYPLILPFLRSIILSEYLAAIFKLWVIKDNNISYIKYNNCKILLLFFYIVLYLFWKDVLLWKILKNIHHE